MDVSDAVRQNGGPMAACKILSGIEIGEARPAPPTVYGASTTLTGADRAHRLGSIDAFVSCQCAHADHAPVLAICDDCGSLEEQADEIVMDRLTAIMRETGFQVRRQVVEVHGSCGSRAD